MFLWIYFNLRNANAFDTTCTMNKQLGEQVAYS